jgi:hypothetical protein
MTGLVYGQKGATGQHANTKTRIVLFSKSVFLHLLMLAFESFVFLHLVLRSMSLAKNV